MDGLIIKKEWLDLILSGEKTLEIRGHDTRKLNEPIYLLESGSHRLLYFYCPRCGKFIVGSYETDKKRGGGISQKLNGCSNCLQAIDFSEWQKKESDDLVLED